MKYALVGNQNCGKTTLFNALTGSNQHVGNFPGVTVDSKVGIIKSKRGHHHKDNPGASVSDSVVDLPGIYSLRPYTSEEIVTRDFIIKEHPDAIIDIVDATNIERNLYLTLQLIEMGKPMVIALNMMDELNNNGGSVDTQKMSDLLGVPVVPISAINGEGVQELISKVHHTAHKRIKPTFYDFCPPGPVHRAIHAVSHVVEDHAEALDISPRFCSTKLIEGDENIIELLKLDKNELDLIEHSVLEMESERGLDRNAALADMRYAFIENLCSECVVKSDESIEHKRSAAIDNVLTNKYLALPVFFAIMALIFWLTFGVIGQPLSDLLSEGIDAFTALVDNALTEFEINPVMHSLIIDGIFAGVGSMLSFLPLIVVLFFFLSILEDTGYMARVAFVMDKLLRKIGLSGRSFVPMLIGFGCSVPAVMASRTLSSERDRKMTIMLVPFMSCSAKIPIYAVFSAAFFPEYSTLVMICLYIGGMVVGVLSALLLKNTIFHGKPVPFVMELPNYRLPSAKSVALLMWEKARDFIERAFTVILLGTVIIWFLQTFDIRFNVVADSSDSMLAGIGRLIAPVFAPLGFNDWRAATALLSGFTAKESVISTLGVLLRTGSDELGAALATMFSSVSAISYLTFTLLYTPCVAAVAAIKKEINSGIKTVGIVIFQCSVAWVAAFVVYHIAMLF